VRVAVLGTGRMGSFRAEWLRAHPDVEEVLVGSIRAGTVESVLDARPDAVVIASATPDHPAHIRACAERGVKMLCEKPIALTLAETRRALDDAGDLVQVAFERRFDPGFAEARRLVASGALGTVYCVRMTAFDHEPSPEHFIPGSGGIFRDMHIHDFDTARWLTGSEVERVYAVGAVRQFEQFARHGDVDTAAILLTMADGLPIVVSGARHDPRGYDCRAELLGSEDSIAVGVNGRTPLRSVEPDAPPPGANPWRTFIDRFGAAFDGELHAFLEFARGERENPCPGVEALHALRVAVACDRSRAEGRPVRMEEVDDGTA
jgi:myo-inositol 2-dehydrogenase/D-chiro-inositol 1-dehydrogenase